MTAPRRGRAVPALAALALAAAACGATDAGGDTTSPAAALASDACGALVQPTVQTGTHLIGDADPPVPYSSTPASSGWHATSVPPTGALTTPLSDPQIVALLEQGVVVVTHTPDAAPDPEVARRLADQFPDRLAIAPYAGTMPSPVALVTWGTIARCDHVDPGAVTEFVVDRRVTPDGAH